MDAHRTVARLVRPVPAAPVTHVVPAPLPGALRPVLAVTLPLLAASWAVFAWPAAGAPGPSGLIAGWPPGTNKSAGLDCRPAGVGGAASPAGRPSGAVSYRMAEVLAADGSLAGWDLTVQGPDAASRLRLPPESAARGPVDGWVSVTADDGARSEIRLVSSTSGCRLVTSSADEVVRQAIVAPDGGSVLYHAVGRQDRADHGVWRLPLAGGGPAGLIVPPLDIADSGRSDIGLVWATELRAADDGRRLAVESCGAVACRIRMASLDGVPGARPTRAYVGRLVGIVGRHLVSLLDCHGLACELVAADLASGRERHLAGTVTSATTVELDGRLLAAAITDGPGGGLVVLDIETGARWIEPGPATSAGSPAAMASSRLRLLAAGGAGDAGLEVQPGWVAAIASPAGDLVAIDVARILRSTEGAR